MGFVLFVAYRSSILVFLWIYGLQNGEDMITQCIVACGERRDLLYTNF